MSNPSILFIPGSFSLLPAYQPLFDGITDAGYEVRGIHPPTVGESTGKGRDGPAPSMYDDAEVIAREAEKLADEGKDVILMGHSYAGLPISQSTKGLGKHERAAQGKPGGIVHLAYIACLVPRIGSSAASLLSTLPTEIQPKFQVDEDGWMTGADPKFIAQNLPPKEGERILTAFAKHSARSFYDELTHAGYYDIPSSYLLCEEDIAGPPDFQRKMIAGIEEASAREVAVTSIASDHCPHLSARKDTVEWVQKLVQQIKSDQNGL